MALHIGDKDTATELHLQPLTITKRPFELNVRVFKLASSFVTVMSSG